VAPCRASALIGPTRKAHILCDAQQDVAAAIALEDRIGEAEQRVRFL
jgi:hypothetical protein